MRDLAIAMVFATGLSACSHSPGLQSELQSRVSAWQSEAAVQGVSVAIYDGRQVYRASAGLRQELGQPVRDDDTFSIASVSKSFAAAAIMKMIETGAFELDDKAVELSGLELSSDITVADLLYHQAGLPEYMGGELSFQVFLEQHGQGRSAWTSEEIRQYATSAPEGESRDFAYSNSHYVVLGAILEKQSGSDLGDALEKLVFRPAGLRTARLVRSPEDDPDALGRSGALVSILGSTQVDRRLSRELATAGNAAGGVVASASDLALWAGDYFGGRFVGPIEFQPPGGGEAFGIPGDRIAVGPGAFEVTYRDGSILRAHGGDALGSTALAAYSPAANLAIAVVVNDDKIHALGFGEPGFLDTLARELIDEFSSR